MKKVKNRVLSIILSFVMVFTLIPYNVFAQVEDYTMELEDTLDFDYVLDEETYSEDLLYNMNSVDITTPVSLQLTNFQSNRTFDIQDINYKTSCRNPGLKYQYKWEGIAPYAPIFGHMVNDGKYTRPLGKEYGDLGWGWGSSDWMTGYLLVDLEKLGKKDEENLPKDEEGLSKIGIVRVDNKYSRNDDFSSWEESVEQAFREYNGNEGFTRKGYAGSSAYQETKLVIWDGYKRTRGIKKISKKEYIKDIEDVDSVNTVKRQEIANYIKKHMDNGAKLQGYITVGYGLKDIYEPSESSYLNGKKQIRYVPLIKITGLTYDVELEYINAPTQVELPKIIQVNAGDKINLPEIKDNISVYYDDNNKRIDGDFTVEKNMKIIVKFLDLNDTTDTDSDGLVDVLEELVGTSLTDKDTDNDGLPDSFEVFAPLYDVFNPLIADTDSNGINDGDEDYDEDGLKNKEEIENKTSAFDKDTDGDELEDGEEVYKYKTNPSKIDTDNDGLDDFKEIQLGFNPLVANEKFDITYAPKIDNDTVFPSVKITLSGEQAQSLSIEQYDNEMLFPKDMPGYMGMAYDFNVNGSFDEAVISFRFDKTNLLSDAEPTIYYYNEKEGSLEELPTTVEGNIASAKVSHFSTYILINRTVYDKIFPWTYTWEDEWEESNYNKVDIAFIIDDSGSMESNDPGKERLEASRNLIDKLPSGSGIGIVRFRGKKDRLLTSKLTTNKNVAKAFLTSDYFGSDGGTDMYTAISEAFSLFDKSNKDTFKMMVVLSDGETYDTNLKEGVINTAKNKDIRIFTVGLGIKENSDYFKSHLKPLAEDTKGKYYYIRLAKDIDEAFNNINKKIDTTIDNDKDGLPDYYEDSFKLLNGKIIITDKDNPDTDGDGLKDGEEVKVKYEYSKDRKKVRVKGCMISNPREKDSDGDGDMDRLDPNPMRFILNDRFIDILGKIEVLSNGYSMGSDIKYPVGKEKWYVFMFLRKFNPNYDKNLWNGTGGKIDYKFVNDIKTKDRSLYEYFANMGRIFANDKFEYLDTYHMGATMTGLIYTTSSIDAEYFDESLIKGLILSNTPESIFDDLSGWAGDLQTLMNNTMEVIRKEQKLKGNTNFDNYIPTYDEFYHTFSRLLGDKNYSFSSDDIFADIDAYNIAKELENKDIKSAFTSYYSKGYKKRFTNFLENSNENELKKRVYLYTKETYFGVKWFLLKYKFNDNHSRAARDVFVNFIIAQRGKE